jgi:hypothetical protein
MSLELYARVLWRFRVLVLAGLAAATLLAAMAMFKLPSLEYRQAETWQSTARVMITQDGFPEGRTTLPGVGVPAPVEGEEEAAEDEPPKQVFAEPGRLSSLSLLYAQLANSDSVQEVVKRHARERGIAPGKVTAIAVQEVGIGPLPLVDFLGEGTTGAEARATTGSAVDAFVRYVRQAQAGADILPRDRVDLKVLQQPATPIVTVPRKKTLPVMIFLTVMIITCGIAFVLENLRPVPLRRADLEQLKAYPEPLTNGNGNGNGNGHAPSNGSGSRSREIA